MNMDSYMPVKIFSGKNCVKDNKAVFSGLGNRCLIVTGGSAARLSGALSDAEDALNASGIVYTIFDKITQNPYTNDCWEAGKQAREFHADFILGIGGGSPLDASKAIAIYAANAELSPSEIYLRKYNNAPLPVALIGTTSGTGSEVTGVSVLTNSDNGMKKSISGEDCYARIAFCDYTYTLSVPYGVTVSTCLDALSHAVEAYFSKAGNDMSDIYCEKVFSLLGSCMQYFYEEKALPDEKMREILSLAAIFAGFALNITGTCFPHALGYILTEDFNIPHGRACVAFLPEFIETAEKHHKEKMQQMLSLLDMDKTELLNMLVSLADVDIKISDEQFERYKKRWTTPIKNFSRTPGEFTVETAVEILKKFKF